MKSWTLDFVVLENLAQPPPQELVLKEEVPNGHLAVEVEMVNEQQVWGPLSVPRRRPAASLQSRYVAQKAIELQLQPLPHPVAVEAAVVLERP